MSKTYHIHTFGCQMNVADSGHVAAQLEALGYQPVLQPEAADVIVVNTCVVRQSAEDKAVGKLGALLPIKRRNPNAVIGLMGCMVGVKPSPALAARFPWVDVFMPPSEPGPLVGYLMERDLAGEARAVDEAAVLARYALQDDAEPLPPSRQLPGHSNSVLQSVRHLTQLSGGQSPVAAHVPIVYGCSHACTFCIIPFRRGVERSRPLEEIVAEVRDLVSQGVREVTLLGQIVDRYGYDFPGQRPDLADLLRAVHEVEGLWRIRFLTSHPNYMSDRILHAMRDLPKVCEHVEVPIQAGRRRGAGGDAPRLHRRRLPPSGLSHPHDPARQSRSIPTSSSASPAKATPSSSARSTCWPSSSWTRPTWRAIRRGRARSARGAWPTTCRDEVKVARHKALEDLQAEVQGEITARFVGETVEVLVEDAHKGKWRGRTRQNKLVFFSDAEDWRGRLADVFITWAGPYSMQGRLTGQRPGVGSTEVTLMPSPVKRDA